MTKKKSTRTVSYDKYKAKIALLEIANTEFDTVTRFKDSLIEKCEALNKQLADMKNRYENPNVVQAPANPDADQKQIYSLLLRHSWSTRNRILGHIILDVQAAHKADVKRSEENLQTTEINLALEKERLNSLLEHGTNLENALKLRS